MHTNKTLITFNFLEGLIFNSFIKNNSNGAEQAMMFKITVLKKQPKNQYEPFQDI
jgi:hypothetical protein